jgi:transcription initiation factor IIE alpha subunit
MAATRATKCTRARITRNSRMTTKQIKNYILETIPRRKIFYASDISGKLCIDYRRVLKAIDQLKKEGKIISPKTR